MAQNALSPGREADFSPVSSAKVQNAQSFTLPYVFVAWCLIKHSSEFSLAKHIGKIKDTIQVRFCGTCINVYDAKINSFLGHFIGIWILCNSA
jgi:hypothetical protein